MVPQTSSAAFPPHRAWTLSPLSTGSPKWFIWSPCLVLPLPRGRPRTGHPALWVPQRSVLWPGSAVHSQVLEVVLLAHRGNRHSLLRVPPRDQWTDGAGQPSGGKIPMVLHLHTTVLCSGGKLCINLQVSPATGLSHFKVCHRYQPSNRLHQELELEVPAAQQFISCAKEAWICTRTTIAWANSDYAAQQHCCWSSPAYQPGDIV